MKFRIALLLLFLSISLPAAASPYYVPPGQATASAQVTKSGTAITGQFGNATSGFSYDSQSDSLSNLRIALDGTSLSSDDVADLLGTSRYPEISFAAPGPVTFKDNKASIKGTLTVHGMSKPVTFDATISGTGKSLGLSLHGIITRAEFGIADDAKTPGLYGDQITLTLDMQAIRQ